MPWIETGLYISGAIAVVGTTAYISSKIYKNKNNSKKALEEFTANADVFSGLYEPLYLMSKGDIKFRTGILGDWAVRTANLSNVPNYCEMWNKKLSGCSEWDQGQGLIRMNELLSFIQKAGVCRDTSDQLIVDNMTYKRYDAYEELIEIGEAARVKNPYWYIGDDILEKGTIEKLS